MKALGMFGTLIFTALSSEKLQSTSGDRESQPVSAVETYQERYLTPVVLTGITAFCALQVYLFIMNVRKQFAEQRMQRTRARFQRAVRKAVNLNRIRAKRTSHRIPSAAPSGPAIVPFPLATSDAVELNVSPEAASPQLYSAATPGLGDDIEGTISGPLPELAQASVLLGIEWVEPAPGSSASITLTCVPGEWRPMASPNLVRNKPLIHGAAVDPPLEFLRVEDSENKTVMESQRSQSLLVSVKERIVSMEEATACTYETVQLNPQLVEDSRPSRVASSSQRGLQSASSSKAVGVDSPVGISCKASQEPDANYPPRSAEGQGTVPSFLGSRSSSQLESGQTLGEISSSEALVGRAASPSEGSGVQVVFPWRACPEAATLATWKVGGQRGPDSESICTEVLAASFEVAESGESDGLHSDRDGHSLPIALPRLTLMDLKLELESDCDDDSKYGAHVPPIPTGEMDTDVHPDGDDQVLGRPESEFVWA